MTEELKCTNRIRINDGRDMQGRNTFHHQRCNKPAQEYEIGGILAKAKAIPCYACKLKADSEAFVSENGYPLGKVKKSEKEKGYRQPRLAGSGVLELTTSKQIVGRDPDGTRSSDEL